VVPVPKTPHPKDLSSYIYIPPDEDPGEAGPGSSLPCGETGFTNQHDI